LVIIFLLLQKKSSKPSINVKSTFMTISNN
jgi:hypothetical protein